MEVLLANGADINAADHQGDTPLSDAVRAGRVEAVALLLERGADAGVENKRGVSVVSLAKRMRKQGAAEIVRMLTDDGIASEVIGTRSGVE